MTKRLRVVLILGALLVACAPAFGAHTVTLSCTLPSDWGANSGINWFRGTAAGAEATAPINSTPTTVCAYTDANVIAGQTYFYNATQVVGTLQSPKSNEVSTTVLPYAPLSVTAVAN